MWKYCLVDSLKLNKICQLTTSDIILMCHTADKKEMKIKSYLLFRNIETTNHQEENSEARCL